MKKYIAYNIKWDTDGDMKLFKTLPQEIEIPEEVWEDYDDGNDDAISDYVSDVTGFCHYGFEIRTKKIKEEIDMTNTSIYDIMILGGTYHNDNGKDYIILAFDKDADVAIFLNPENNFTPYVGAKFVRFGSWGSGHYFKTLQGACDWFNHENGSETKTKEDRTRADVCITAKYSNGMTATGAYYSYKQSAMNKVEEVIDEILSEDPQAEINIDIDVE